MRSDRTPAITVLAVSSSPEGPSSLQAILAHSRWRLYHCSSYAGAIALLSAHSIAVVIVDADVQDGTWRDFLAMRESLPGSPLVIVASRLADDRLWAEALNLGAYDVLAKPFHPREVFHSVSLAWRRWKERYEEPARAAAETGSDSGIFGIPTPDIVSAGQGLTRITNRGAMVGLGIVRTKQGAISQEERNHVVIT